ncbi:MAG: hypothetical protein L6461_15500, partial [Anaerolineae bacterium]|nr:hypothetical protein [Anaerolineae bacterium]
MNISTNFFEIVPSKDRVSVPYLGFTDKQQLNDLRRDNPKAIFMRSRDKVLFWGEGSFSSNEFLKITISEDYYLFLNVFAHSFLEQFFQSTVTKISTKNHIYKISFFDEDISKNKYRGVKLYRAFHLHFTPYDTNSSMTLGFTISSSVISRITWTRQDFEAQNLRYDDLRYDEKTGEIFATTDAIYRLANHFNYASQIKQEFDSQNSIQKEHEEINSFVMNYFRNDLNKFLLPDGLQIRAINETRYRTDSQTADYTIKMLPKPESYFYKGNYPNRENSFHQRQKIYYNKPFTYDEFENRRINISVIYPKFCYHDVSNFFRDVQKELIETFKLKKENFTPYFCANTAHFYSIMQTEGISIRKFEPKYGVWV